MRGCIVAFVVCLACSATAESLNLAAIIDGHVLSGYRRLAAEATDLASTAENHCTPTDPSLRNAYHDAFDAWVTVSHLRFGPSEEDNHAFALAFWPDPRGSTPKALGTLLRNEDSVVESRKSFRDISVAARGFHALEFMLYDPQFAEVENTDYQCALIRAITADIADSAVEILDGWRSGYADLMAYPGNETYRTEAEAVRQLFTALSTGLEFTADARLGRPMGSLDRPRPNRAEAWRSGRSLRHVILSLEAARELAAALSGGDKALEAPISRALDRARDLKDPIFAGVVDPQGRLRVESLQRSVNEIRQKIAEDIGPRLGISAGFNSLDGD